jgi:hypothetical protein
MATPQQTPSPQMAELRVIHAQMGDDRLRWAVQQMQQGRRGLTPGQREDLRGQLTVFAGLGPAGGGAEWVDGDLVKVPAEEVVPILTAMEGMIAAAVNRHTVMVPRPVAPYDEVSWDARRRRFISWSDDLQDTDWQWRAQRVLGRMLLERGHLVRSCPAPASRDDGPCAEWFVATSDRQGYCSPRCQSRAATRRFRGQRPGEARSRPRGRRPGDPRGGRRPSA